MDELFGCWREAERADRVATALQHIRVVTGPEHTRHITAVMTQVDGASRLLRDLYDLFPIYRAWVPAVMYFLVVILPCIQRTMMDMMTYIDNGNLSPRAKWSLNVRKDEP